MSLPPGSRVGPYEIIVSIGAGGMGEVYKARDPKLGRDIAIKVLPATVSADPDRLARFEREARALAALNHPNIAQVYGFDDGAIVMELLEGETLRDRLQHGALPVRKAIDYAGQIARGLAAAHDRGIIHRDLKPENIFLLSDGQVKLLDFGLARPVVAAPSGATETQAAAGTDPGTVLGTVGYMSPEQVRAGSIDHRSDLFSLGAVLYELLSGERAFRRSTTAETMTAILREEPGELSSIRADISPAIDRIVRHALEKNPVERFQSARDIAFALDALSGSASAAMLPTASRPRFSIERIVWAALTIVLLGVLVFQSRRKPAAVAVVPATPYQLNLALPDEVRSNELLLPVTRMGLSNDGMQLAYSGVDPAGAPHMWVISLRNGVTREIAGAAGAFSPTWSPDGSQLVFSLRSAGNLTTRQIAATGGTAETIAPFGGPKIWSSTGVMLFSVSGPLRWREPGSETFHDYAVEGRLVRAFSFLPDGRRFLLSEFADRFTPVATSIASIDSMERIRLVDGAAPAFYGPGAIAYVKGPALMAQRFDERSSLSGQPVTITEGIDQSMTGGSAVVASPTGTLVVQRPEPPGRWRLQWYRRDGAFLSTVSQPADYSNAELSPDGRRLLVTITDPAVRARDVYIIDLERGVRQRLTFEPADERSAVWTPDGQRVIYRSTRTDLYIRRSDFTGEARPLITDGTSKDPYSVSRDGKFVAYRVTGTSGTNDVMIAPLDAPGPPRAIRATEFDENGGSFSPDGRSLAYASDESGQPEVYVIATDGSGSRVQLSTGGGRFARWSRNGTEIFYISPSRMLMSVPVRGSGATFLAGVAKPLFHIDVPQGAGNPYDVTPDGQRIIVIASPDGGSAKPALTAFINWPALIER